MWIEWYLGWLRPFHVRMWSRLHFNFPRIVHSICCWADCKGQRPGASAKLYLYVTISAPSILFYVFGLFNFFFWFFFQVLCEGSDKWLNASITEQRSTSLIIKPSINCCYRKVRYAWNTNPCFFKHCLIYSGNLPSPPFIKDGPFWECGFEQWYFECRPSEVADVFPPVTVLYILLIFKAISELKKLGDIAE